MGNSQAETPARVWVAGHRGMVGSAIAAQLVARGTPVVTADRDMLDLRDAAAVAAWLRLERPDAVILAAAKVGGIHANETLPADFIYDNLAIATAVIHAAHEAGIGRLVFLGSSCIYPKLAPQPIQEASLLTGPLEPTNEWYAIAKIAGVKLCQAYRQQHGRRYISVMPCNLYGPGDNFSLAGSHVIPALLHRFHQAAAGGLPEVSVWGSGTALREFLHVDDLARGVIHCLDHYDGHDPINCGSGSEISIADLAHLVARIVGYSGRIGFDPTKPDGTPRKLLDSSRIGVLGWAPRISLEAGLAGTYQWYRAQGPAMRR